MKREVLPIIVLLLGLGAVVALAHSIDKRRYDNARRFQDEQLYLNGTAAKRLSLAFNGLAADWYWMRSLQYVGGKIVSYEDTHPGQFQMTDLSKLDLRLLAGLLDVTTTLDPQFIPAYEYGAVILPEINPDQAIALLNKGIAANPSSWRLHQHLGYIYWQRQDYERASAVYAAGAKLPRVPAWMEAMAARMKAEGGSRDAAREMYWHLQESSEDPAVKDMVRRHLMRLDWLDDRDVIRHALLYSQEHSRDGRCPTSWRGVFEEFPGTRLRFDTSTGAPVDSTGLPYRLINGGCDVDLDPNSEVPH